MRVIFPTLAIALLLFAAGLPLASSHNVPDQPTEGPGGAVGLTQWTFKGPANEPIESAPCSQVGTMSWEVAPGVYPPNTQPFTPGETAPHVGHIFAIQSIKKPFEWVKADSIIDGEYHFMQYETRNDLAGPDDYTGNQIMLGPDGFARMDMTGTIYDQPEAPDLWIQDFHEHSSYCVYGKPLWDKTGPFLFIGNGFVENGPWYWDGYNYAQIGGGGGLAGGNANGSPLDLAIYYRDLYQDRYGTPGGPALVAEVEQLLLVGSFDKYPAARAYWNWDVSDDLGPWPGIDDNGREKTNNLGVDHRNLIQGYMPNVTYDYQYDRLNPPNVIQEHWVELNSTAVRYGWPEREEITDNSPDPLAGWEWFIDTHPDPTISTAFQARDCIAPLCSDSFPFPNPYPAEKPLQPIYLDLVTDPHDPTSHYVTDSSNTGSFEVCFFVYSASHVDPKTGEAYFVGDSINSDIECKEIVVENLKPIAKIMQPVPPPIGPKQFTWTFIGLDYDPDGVPQCLSSWTWEMDDAGSFTVDITDVTHPWYTHRNSPTVEFATGGSKKIVHSVMDCNGGISDDAVLYIDVPPNQPPYFDPVPQLTLIADEERCFNAVAHDPEQRPLDIVTHDGGFPFGMQPKTPPLGNAPIQVCWTPTAHDIGTYPGLRFWARDDLGAVGELIVDVIVIRPDLDSDSDGRIDLLDTCPAVNDPSQADHDLNGIGDACDGDADKNGIPDHLEDKILGPYVQAGAQAYDLLLRRAEGADERDTDSDGIVDSADNCPTTKNRAQTDWDADSIGDACDLDMDGDGVVQVSAEAGVFLDNCPAIPNADQADADKDGIGNACDADHALGKANLERMSGRIPSDACTDCHDATSTNEVQSTPLAGRGLTGLAMALGLILAVIMSTVLATWAVRRWKQ